MWASLLIANGWFTDCSLPITSLPDGSWSEYFSNSGNVNHLKKRGGFGSSCQPCNQDLLEQGTYTQSSYSFTEDSYGVGGWFTVVAADGRIAVLIPKMSLSATGTVVKGAASGSITSDTTAQLWIVDETAIDFDLASAQKGYTLTGCPASRDDLGIKPNCWARDLPLDIDLRGLHWYGDTAFLVTFVLQDVFYAYLLEKKKDTGWQAIRLGGFEQWVSENNLKEHLMFLN